MVIQQAFFFFFFKVNSYPFNLIYHLVKVRFVVTTKISIVTKGVYNSNSNVSTEVLAG